MKTPNVEVYMFGDEIIFIELERIKKCCHFVCAWWTPDYECIRRNELKRDIASKNKDIQYIEKMGW